MNFAMQETLCLSLRRHLLIGVAVTIVLWGGFIGWAATAELSGAVIAAGKLVVEGNVKTVQHPTGGVIAELLVHEGQVVKAGDVVARLDATVAKASLAAISANLNQLYAREARLTAERDGQGEVPAPDILNARLGDVEAEKALNSERRLFTDRWTVRVGKKKQLEEQVAQLKEQVGGLHAQRQAKDDEIALIEKEMIGTRKLYDMGLISLNRINNLDRSIARLQGERGQLVAQSATIKGQMAEIALKLLDIDQSMHAEVAQELRDVQNKQTELIEREVAALDESRRIDILAPVSGAVHSLTVHTQGAVIKPGETLMEIVPETILTVEARIPPQDIDQVYFNQPATLRLTAFNRNTTPEIEGQVIRISADLETDEKSGVVFYRADISIPDGEQARLPNLKLIPGMPVEAAIRTGDRTVLSYLVKPIHDHAARAFREE